ncbi:SCA7, zinc-binding domain-containing protein [Amylostereum chailletii]|nr:SCA7, zinc-binding domain-containing protein [Amylostereum chailletii]
MALKLRPTPSPPPLSFNNLPSTPPPPSPSTSTSTSSSSSSPPTTWLSAREMKVFGSESLHNATDIGLVQCKDCAKPILRSAAAEHAETCRHIRSGKKGPKVKVEDAGDVPFILALGKGKKRKADETETNDTEGPKLKKVKNAAKPPPKPRIKGPVNLDRHCGVINDKNLPCSRSLTCKSHSMGAKRAVQGRSKAYDELLLDWNRENNPNFVEPVKRETKKEKKEKKDAEKRERKRRELEDFALKNGIDLSQPGAEAHAEQLKTQSNKKKKGASTATATATIATANPGAAGVGGDDGAFDNMAELDSEEELETMAISARIAAERGMLGAPLALPCDAGSWFVVRREKLRNCRDLFANALMKNGISSVGPAGAGARPGSNV